MATTAALMAEQTPALAKALPTVELWAAVLTEAQTAVPRDRLTVALPLASAMAVLTAVQVKALQTAEP
ncbi:hypothetical protein GCM10022235_53690 [Kribbella ginsengisoli]|uniref:Uncharacterized protein n=1 Tax=Kribbella ginsengisoli TaxID=363865 RepID=A0ABP6Y450_9ACTN